MEIATKEVGRVFRVVKEAAYGWLLTDGKERIFFHKKDTVAKALPSVDALMRFDRVKVNIPGKADRAINVEAIQ